MVNKGLINPYFWGGWYVRVGRLTSHDVSDVRSCYAKELVIHSLKLTCSPLKRNQFRRNFIFQASIVQGICSLQWIMVPQFLGLEIKNIEITT